MKTKIFNIIRLLFFIPMFFISTIVLIFILSFLADMMQIDSYIFRIFPTFVLYVISYVISYLIAMMVYPYKEKFNPFLIIFLLYLTSIVSLQFYYSTFEGVENIRDLFDKRFFKFYSNLIALILSSWFWVHILLDSNEA